ncbi:uncharacterized protein LOC134275244 [Saccostrea cucullata]|uniref:uncharacterized protein LOC134275244 n=1 Tax=Saccostrea cuccullata TaxID=36930 RepID=UPI002ED5B5EB
MDSIRTSMKAEAESLKNMVDTVLSENMEELYQIEKSLLEKLKSQEKTLDDYIAYLSDLVKEFQNRKAELRRIKPMVIPPIVTSMKSTSEQTKQDKHVKSDKKQTMSLSASVTKVREFYVQGVDDVYHVSLDQSDRLWISDRYGNLVQTDLQGNVIQKIKTSGKDEGYHSVTQDRDLIFTDQHKKVINRITKDNTITEFIKTEDWTPLSIHSSHINGDLLVGMFKDEVRGLIWMKDSEAKVTRYNKTGKELQNIQRDNKGQKLYGILHYITENINGDICTSDYDKGVVVVNKSGQHRFSYTGQKSGFSPYGICTDVLGHILVCDVISKTVHLLDQNGHFLSLSHTNKGFTFPVVCVWMMRTISM